MSWERLPYPLGRARAIVDDKTRLVLSLRRSNLAVFIAVCIAPISNARDSTIFSMSIALGRPFRPIETRQIGLSGPSSHRLFIGTTLDGPATCELEVEATYWTGIVRASATLTFFFSLPVISSDPPPFFLFWNCDILSCDLE
jgi:hypothetical protein